MTQIKREPYVVPGVEIGPENPLPIFRGPKQEFKPYIVEGLDPEETKYIGWETAYRVLPHRMQDGYTADRHTISLDSVVLENKYLKVIFMPSAGGHVMSIFHKPSQTEILQHNPIFQPRNLALRNAWLSGGIEFNCGQMGHHYLTCSPIHACKITGANGEPGLRMYVWERVKGHSYQIDFYLPPDSQFLYMHVRIVNPHDYEISMYWWTNIGAPESEDRRVLVPANSCIYNGIKGFELGHLPIIDDYNVQYSTTIKHSMEFFYRMAPDQRRWVTTLDKDGKGFFQTSTSRLVGRKLFVWGTSQGGERWQEYLAGPNTSYVELQTGLAQTQAEHVPMPANTEWTWTEAFGLLEMDPKAAHDPDWQAAWKAADAAVEKTLPAADVDNWHEKFEELMHQPCGEMISLGLGWGALERVRTKVSGVPDKIPENLAFDETDLTEDQQPWLTLLKEGKLPETDAACQPGQFMIQPEWKEMLQKSIESGKSDHWLGWYHMGVAHVEAFERAEAVEAFEKSLKHKRTSWALRNLAFLERQEKRFEAARALYKEAWETGPVNVYLAKEYVELLLRMGINEELIAFRDALPEDIKADERIRLMWAWAKVRLDEFDEAEKLFEYIFVSMAEGEGSLATLWFEMHERRLAKELGVEIDDELKARVREEYPPLKRFDYRVSRDVAQRE